MPILMADPPEIHWFALRDLKRRNAKLPAYMMLSQAGFEVFTPMKTEIITTAGNRRERRRVPCITDLVFVRTSRRDLDPIVLRTPTLQYRYVRGGLPGAPLTVNAADMERFISAVSRAERVDYYSPAEITPAMLGRSIRLVCDGPLNGHVCRLLNVSGSPRRRRVLVDLPGLLTAAVTLSPSYIQLLP